MYSLLRKIAWVLTLLCMAFIFYMSARPMAVSRADSARFMAAFGLVAQEDDAYNLDDPAMFKLHNAVRKYAHIVVYAGLGALYFVSVYGYFGGIRASGTVALLLTALYGATDELHQLFTNRGVSLSDVLIDALGGLAGIVLVGFMFWLIKKNRRLRAFLGRGYDFEPSGKGMGKWKKSA